LRVTLRPANGLPMTIRKRPSRETSSDGSGGVDQRLAG
jgi:hypothetical protein